MDGVDGGGVEGPPGQREVEKGYCGRQVRVRVELAVDWDEAVNVLVAVDALSTTAAAVGTAAVSTVFAGGTVANANPAAVSNTAGACTAGAV